MNQLSGNMQRKASLAENTDCPEYTFTNKKANFTNTLRNNKDMGLYMLLLLFDM